MTGAPLSLDPARTWLADQIRSRVIGDEPDTKAAAVMRSSSLAARTSLSRIRPRWATVNIDRVSHAA